MTSKAFCPGHITGFFTVSEIYDELEKVGSRGAGFSIELGAISEVTVGGERWDIVVDGVKTPFPVVEKTLEKIASGGEAIIKTEIPFSQGFGMSGACALSAGMAALYDIEMDPKKAIRLAHVAEVSCQTGLGDVVGQSVGGFEIRLKEGIPPKGIIKNKSIEHEVVLGIVGPPLITTDILGDQIVNKSIIEEGNICMDDFLPENGFDRFIEISYHFAERTKFLRKSMKDLLKKIENYGKGSMAMIGNSIFLFGETKKLVDILQEDDTVEQVFVTKIDNHGARVL
ncbi:MAG: pantoate kinase [Thermoplasmatota archaeon]